MNIFKKHPRGDAPVAIIGILVAAVLGLVVLFTLIIGWQSVDGSERIVWQSYNGVQKEIAMDGIHWYVPALTTPHPYVVATQRFVIDDEVINPKNDYITKEEQQMNQPDMEPLVVPVQMDRLTAEDLASGKTTGPTNVIMRCSMQYHLDDSKLVALHNDKRSSYEQSFVADVVREAIIDNTTILDARTVYQGEGRVRLQQRIEKELKENPRFDKYGIVVENFIIRKIDLEDTDFLNKITAEARAEQDRKTAMKQQLAYQATADAEREKAKAEQYRRLVEADTKKGEQIAKAEAAKEQEILAAQASAAQVKLAAEADKERARLEGEGIRLKKVAEAEGVLALGKAEAEAQKLKLQAYQGEGGERFAEVQKAQAFGEAIKQVQYLPSDMKFITVAKDFMEAVKMLPQRPQAQPNR